MAMYINAMEAISPQNTFGLDRFPGEICPPENGAFSCQQPVYKAYIKPKLLRRMSKVIRMGVTAGLECLKKSNIDTPDAIVVGTSLGCVQDTIKFLKQIDENGEQLLNPTAFIQSTHNTVSGQIALLLGCRSYNLTFTQRTLSFENALMDTCLVLSEKPEQTILLGGIDEITPESLELIQRSGCAKKSVDTVNSVPEKGYIPGEGTAFFTVTNQKSDKNKVEISKLSVLPAPENEEQVKQFIQEQINACGLSPEQIDAVMIGVNGDLRNDRVYQNTIETICPDSTQISYKNLVGEYDTASSFAMWMGAQAVEQQTFPKPSILKEGKAKELRHILLFNHHKGKDYSLIILSKC